jgi:hypothetical protein
MSPFTRYPRRAAALAAAALVVAAACTDRSPVSPDPDGGGGGGPVAPGRPVHLVAVTCRVDVRGLSARCDDAPPPEGGASTDLILGGQNRYVNLEMGAVNYDPGTQTYQLTVSVRNLIQQALGTTDGVSLDPNGVRVFLQDGPNTTSGTGDVTVAPDGKGTFTATGQPYFQYNTVLDQFELSSPRTWNFQMPSTVTAFAFTAYVSAAVRYPDGWVDVIAEPITMRPHAQLKLTPQSRDAAGNPIPSQFYTWATPDSTIVTVTGTAAPVSAASGGMLGSVRAGTVEVGVVSGPRTGSVTVTVTGMKRVWQGDVSNAYATRGNWENDVVPVQADTIVVPNPSPNWPTLSASAQIGGIELAEGAILALNAFDMTASRNVTSSTAGSTGITSSTGRLFLAGTAATVSGRVPRLRVTGTYSLTGNLWAAAPLQVDLGRLTSTGFRIEANNNF